ncbi:DUF4139 domain-containing protein [Kiloniella sp. EL199]|uniref:DUF4139 domain-containing protein n=1 Tax=Kiloniella sp. EL199 TaxID=2107581 RepID=UPI000EA39341|nr:DUF4139 domain-containing protein [Kiloniella sp. EL199]
MTIISKFLQTSYLVGATVLASSSLAVAQEIPIGEDANQSTELVFYSNNLGQVSQTRRSKLSAGGSTLALEDVSPHLLLDSLFIAGEGVRVREQRLDQQILSPQRLLEASLGKTVTLIRTNPETGEEHELKADVLAVREGVVLRIDGKIETGVSGRLVYDSIPEGLRAGPTLLAVIDSTKGGEKDLKLTYLTGGLDWRVTYVADLDPTGEKLSLKAMATLTNQTGVEFVDADVRLVAGNVQRVQPAPAPRMAMMSAESDMMYSKAKAVAPQRQSVADRDVYRLPDKIDIGGVETKQVTLLENDAVEIEKRYRFRQLIQPYPGADETGRQQADIVLKTENTDDKGLGQPLPEGTIRVYQQVKDANSSIFMGEEHMRAVPKGEEVELVIGSANQVTGSGKQLSYENLSRSSYQLTQEITLRNSGDKAVSVDVVGNMPRNWKILNESLKHEKKSANKIIWTLEIPAEGKASFDYKLRVSNE